MNDFFEMVIPCAATLTIFGMILGFIAYMRYLRYKETIALAEKGLLRQQRNLNGKKGLYWGIMITAIGLGLCVGVLPVGLLVDEAIIGPWILVGVLPMSVGIGLLVIYWLTRKDEV